MRQGGQARRIRYMGALQLPWLPEAVLRRRLLGVLTSSGLPREDAERYAARFREPGLASGGLAWYRALAPGAGLLLRRRKALRRNRSHGARTSRRITVPTTYLWGRHDPALGRAAAERTGDWVASDYRFVELDAGHWLPETRAEEVAAAVLVRTSPNP